MLRAGWERTSLREVAEEAGVAKGLVVYHFGSKEGLFVSMQALVFEELAQHIAATVERVGPSKRTALWALGELVHTTLETQRSVLPLVLELWAIAARDPDARRLAVEGRQWLRGLLLDSLRRVIGDDVARMELSPETMADLLMAVLTGMLVALELDGDEARIERSIAELEAKAGALLTPRRAKRAKKKTKKKPTQRRSR